MSKESQRGMSLAEQIQAVNREAAGILGDGRKLLKDMKAAEEGLRTFFETEVPRIVAEATEHSALHAMIALESRIRVQAAIDGNIAPKIQRIQHSLDKVEATLIRRNPEFARAVGSILGGRQETRLEVVVTGMRIDGHEFPEGLTKNLTAALERLKCVKETCRKCDASIYVLPSQIEALKEHIKKGATHTIMCVTCAQTSYNETGGEWVAVDEVSI